MINKIKIIYGGSNPIQEFNYEIIITNSDSDIYRKTGKYKGNFKKTESKKNIPNGEGTWNSIDGDYAKGTWINGEFTTGQVKYKYKNGDIFEGLLKESMYDSYGEYTYADGDYAKGTWIKGEFTTGEVKYKYSTGNIYEGRLVNGKYNGDGKYTLANGDFEKAKGSS